MIRGSVRDVLPALLGHTIEMHGGKTTRTLRLNTVKPKPHETVVPATRQPAKVRTTARAYSQRRADYSRWQASTREERTFAELAVREFDTGLYSALVDRCPDTMEDTHYFRDEETGEAVPYVIRFDPKAEKGRIPKSEVQALVADTLLHLLEQRKPDVRLDDDFDTGRHAAILKDGEFIAEWYELFSEAYKAKQEEYTTHTVRCVIRQSGAPMGDTM